jgi:uncharacterized membrane protein (Fun14 family)
VLCFLSIIPQLGISGCAGICCGITLKQAGRGMAVVLGVTFTGLQLLSSLGYIHINYDKVTEDCNNAMDLNGDGKVDEKDAVLVYDKLMSLLTANLPNASGFCSGFCLGVYYG